jgi:hypothetical protein
LILDRGGSSDITDPGQVDLEWAEKMLAAARGQLKDLANVELIEGRAVEGRAVEGPSMEHSWDVYP